MPNMKRITLKDPVTGDILIPTGTGLGYELTPDAPVPPYEVVKNADLLEGHPASYFAVAGEGPDMSNYYTKAEVDALLRPITPQPPSSHTPGDIITWYGYQWLVCHYDSNMNQVYLITKDIISTTKFGNNGTYAGSTLASVADQFKNELNSNALSQCVGVSVSGVISKVFAPSKEQMDGGFSWFNSNDRRIAYYSGSAEFYWMSSTYDSSRGWLIYPDGRILGGATTDQSHGFRPCVCVQL